MRKHIRELIAARARTASRVQIAERGGDSQNDMAASIVRRAHRDQVTRLASAILRQALIDARSGGAISPSHLEPWACLAGIRRERLHETFERIGAGDQQTLMLIEQL